MSLPPGMLRPELTTAAAPTPLLLPADYILVPRSTVLQLQAHLASEYARFPARRLRQAIKIVEHMLGARRQQLD